MTLGLENAPNARDLGGLVTVSGRRVRTGVLFRADALHRLTDDDVVVLAGLNLACVIDFRHGVEAQRVGVDRLPTPPPRHIHLPIFDPDHDKDVFAVIGDVLAGHSDASELDFLRETAVGGGAPALMADLYRRFVSGARSRAAFAEALRLVATSSALPLLFHCTAGKDRTGWLSAIILTALDVDREAIVADYLRTNELSTAGRAFVLSVLDGKIPDPLVMVPLMEARVAYLDAAFAEADRLYGGMAGYLREGLGADDALLESLHTNLLD